jgi:hypothetical protein
MKRPEIVQHIEVLPLDKHNFSFGQFAAWAGLVSIFPRIAVTGAIFSSSCRIEILPTSPRCRMRSTPASAGATSGRSRPWVSLTMPIFI